MFYFLVLLVEAGAEYKFQTGSAALPGEGDPLLFHELGPDARRAVGRADQDPVPAAIVDGVVPQIMTQPDTVADVGETLLRFGECLGWKRLFAAKNGAAQDQLHTLLRLGRDELQTLLHFVAECLGWFELDGNTLHFVPVGILGLNRRVKNYGAMI